MGNLQVLTLPQKIEIIIVSLISLWVIGGFIALTIINIKARKNNKIDAVKYNISFAIITFFLYLIMKSINESHKY